ncbi:MAG: hypothetical protein AAF438_12515 [Pseudomonadota bacterium]
MKSLAVLLLLMLSICGCENPTVSVEPKMSSLDTVQIINSPSNLDAPMDPLKIVEATVEGSQLLLTVEYSGGAKEHDFALYCGRAIAKSMPPQASVFLSHNAHGDLAKALIRKELQFDLTPMAGLGASEMVIRLFPPGERSPVAGQLVYRP